MLGLSCGMWGLWVWHDRSLSLTRDQTQALSIGSVDSWPLDCQGRPSSVLTWNGSSVFPSLSGPWVESVLVFGSVGWPCPGSVWYLLLSRLWPCILSRNPTEMMLCTEQLSAVSPWETFLNPKFPFSLHNWGGYCEETTSIPCSHHPKSPPMTWVSCIGKWILHHRDTREACILWRGFQKCLFYYLGSIVMTVYLSLNWNFLQNM